MWFRQKIFLESYSWDSPNTYLEKNTFYFTHAQKTQAKTWDPTQNKTQTISHKIPQDMDKKIRKIAGKQIWPTHKLLEKSITPNKTLHRLCA